MCAEGVVAYKELDEVVLRHAREHHGPVKLLGAERAEAAVPGIGREPPYDPIRLEKVDGHWRLSDVSFIGSRTP